MNTEQVLQDTIDIVELGWVQRRIAVDDCRYGVNPLDPGACKWCLMGALIKAIGYSIDTRKDHEEMELIWDLESHVEGGNLYEWNDKKGRKKEDVINFLHKSIERRRQKGHRRELRL